MESIFGHIYDQKDDLAAIYHDFDWGELHGILSALRWALKYELLLDGCQLYEDEDPGEDRQILESTQEVKTVRISIPKALYHLIDRRAQGLDRLPSSPEGRIALCVECYCHKPLRSVREILDLMYRISEDIFFWSEMQLLEEVKRGLVTIQPGHLGGLQSTAANLKEYYGMDTFSPYTTFERGVLCGKRDTLNWLRGRGWHDWDDQ